MLNGQVVFGENVNVVTLEQRTWLVVTPIRVASRRWQNSQSVQSIGHVVYFRGYLQRQFEEELWTWTVVQQLLFYFYSAKDRNLFYMIEKNLYERKKWPKKFLN